MIYVIFIIIIVLIASFVSVYNDIQRLNIKMDEAFANIDVALAKRYSVLTKLFEVAKGYAKHEKETLVAAIDLRNGLSLEEKEEAASVIEGEFARFNVLAESYPDLKADSVFLRLQEGVVDTEEHLQAARRLYNSNVSRFLQRVQTFPGSLFAGSVDINRRGMLEFSSEEIADVNVKF